MSGFLTSKTALEKNFSPVQQGESVEIQDPSLEDKIRLDTRPLAVQLAGGPHLFLKKEIILK